MIGTTKVTSVDPYELRDWLQKYVSNDFPKYRVLIIPSPWESRGESRFVSIVEIHDNGITKEELIKLVKPDSCRTKNDVHFYAGDVISAAYHAGVLPKGIREFWLYHRW